MGIRPGISQGPHLNFEHLGTAEGLSNGTVERIMQDSRGFMWFLTRGGLDRYDGGHFTNFTLSNDPQRDGVLGSDIEDLAEDSLGYIWTLTLEGHLQRYDPRAGTFEQVDPARLGTYGYHALGGRKLTTTASHVYVLYGTRLLRVDAQTTDVEDLSQDRNAAGALPAGPLVGLDQGPDGTLWVCTRDMIAHSTDGNSWTTVPAAYDLSPDGVFFVRLLARESELIALVEGNRIATYDLDTKRWARLIEPQKNDKLLNSGVNALCLDRSNRLWVGTNNGLMLVRADGSYASFTHNPVLEKSISGNIVQSIFEDDRGMIWIGTEGSGLNMIDPFRTPFQWYRHNPFDGNSLSSNHVTSVAEVDNSGLWIATWGGGINYLDRRNGKFTHFNRSTHEDIFKTNLSSFIPSGIPGEFVVTIGERPDTSYRIRSGSNKLEKWVHPELPEQSPFRHALSFTDSQGRRYYWRFKAQGGLLYFDPGKDEFILFPRDEHDPAEFNQYRIYGIAETSAGRIWISTIGGGLHLFDPELLTFRSFLPVPGDPRSISHVNIGEVFEDSSNNIWVGSYAEGVDVIPREALNKDSIYFLHYTEANAGLEGLWETGMLEDEQGLIWICTQQNLHRQIPGTMTFMEVKLEEHFHSFNWWGFNKGQSGRIYVGTSNGLFVFHPDSMRINDHPPRVFITDFRINNQSTPIRGTQGDTLEGGSPLPRSPLFTPELDLRHDQSNFGFEFAALNYTLPEKNRFQYKLEPYETAWRTTGADRPFATYTNIPAGAYTFQVRAANNDGIWNEEGVAMALTIAPPWWQSAWAYLLYGLALLALLIALFLYQRRRWQLQASLQLEQERARRLAELDQFKSRFYTNITHEFRTPLTVIGGMVEQLSGPERSKSLIRRNVDRLLGMVNQLLDLSRLEHDQLRIDWTQADVIPFLQHLTESFHSACRQWRINLAFFSPQDELVMDFDADKMQQIVVNLLTNAIKFTPELGTIQVSALQVEADGRPWLELAVSDTGKGIPPDQLPHIFDRFYQVDDSSTRAGEGTGIGLALVHELVQLLGGRVEVASETGKGSTFRVLLPIHRRAETGEVEDHLAPAGEAAAAAVMAEAGARPAMASPQGDKPQILVVEDNADVTAYIVSCLRPHYAIQTAVNGREGLEHALEHIPDIILCDVMMPQMDGYALCQTLKADRRTSHIPTIMLTAKATREDRLTGLARGADAYLVKPFDREELLLRLRNQLAQARRLRDHLSNPAARTEGHGVMEQREAAFLEELNGIVEEHLADEQFDTHRLCRAIGMSRAQLHRKLKALTGLPTATYIRTCRLRRAKHLLETTELPVGDVASQVGFKGFSHFSRSFAKEFGISPSETRK